MLAAISKALLPAQAAPCTIQIVARAAPFTGLPGLRVPDLINTMPATSVSKPAIFMVDNASSNSKQHAKNGNK